MFTRKSVARITKSLTKTISELETLTAAERAKAEKIEAQINTLHEQQKAANKEANRAAIVAGRISALLEG